MFQFVGQICSGLHVLLTDQNAKFYLPRLIGFTIDFFYCKIVNPGKSVYKARHLKDSDLITGFHQRTKAKLGPEARRLGYCFKSISLKYCL